MVRPRRAGRERDLVWALLDAEGRHIGFYGLHRVDWHNRCATGGLVIGERGAQGKGYGTDTIRTRLLIAFDQMGLHRVQGDTFNAPMQ